MSGLSRTLGLGGSKNERAELFCFGVPVGDPFIASADVTAAVRAACRPPDDLTSHDAAAIVLRKAGREMRTAEIVQALRNAGYGARVANLQSAVFTALSRKEHLFVKTGPGVWALRKSESAEAG